jgi:hypothetical protein
MVHNTLHEIILERIEEFLLKLLFPALFLTLMWRSMSSAQHGELLRTVWLTRLVAEFSELVAFAPTPFRDLLTIERLLMMSWDMIETETGWWIIIVFAVAPVLMRIEATSRCSEASFGTVLVVESTMLLSEDTSECIQLQLGIGFELSPKFNIDAIVVASPSKVRVG